MISNIIGATSQKIKLLTEDRLKTSSIEEIRTKFPRYNSYDEIKILPQPKIKRKIPYAFSDEKQVEVDYDPQIFQ